jgi:hypothetical protein
LARRLIRLARTVGEMVISGAGVARRVLAAGRPVVADAIAPVDRPETGPRFWLATVNAIGVRVRTRLLPA